MSDNSVARVNIDVAGTLIVSGANSVFVNNSPIAVEGSSTIEDGVISTSLTTVFAENNHVAAIGAVAASGSAVSSGSRNVFAGKDSK